MPDSYGTEWRNENQLRKYPFADGSSLRSDQGYVLPDGAFLDAMIYLAAESAPYIGLIDAIGGIVGIYADDVLACSAEIVSGNDILEFFDTYGRRVGTMIAGPDLTDLPGPLTFQSDAAPLCTACAFNQAPGAVTAFMLPDGTVVSGNVTFAGVDGLRVASYTDDDGNHILRFDAVGVPEDPPCVDLPPPATCIDVLQDDESDLTIDRVDNHIVIGHRSMLAEVCTDKDYLPDEEGVLPTEPPYDPCDPPDPPGPCPPVPPWDPPGPCPEDPQAYFISVGGDLLSLEPFIGAPVSIAAFVDDVTANRLQPRPSQGILLKIRGIAP